jgi:hypothetical protein
MTKLCARLSQQLSVLPITNNLEALEASVGGIGKANPLNNLSAKTFHMGITTETTERARTTRSFTTVGT